MKKFFTFLIPLVLICSLASCNVMDRPRMIEYYSQTDNYIELEGEIKEILITEGMKLVDMVWLGIDLICENEDFDSTTGFAIYGYSNYDFTLSEGDLITFKSAPMIFYNGHYHPIVSLERGGVELINFDFGLEKYIEWIINY